MPTNPPHAPITVVSGLPRSGTSMMMQMLEASGMPILCDHERTRDESNPNGYYELEAVKSTARDASWVEAAPGHVVKVIHALLPHLPADYRYRVILMQRDVREVVTSQSRMLGSLESDASQLSDERLADIFRVQLDETRQLLERDPRFEWIAVRHADLFDEDDLTVRRICRFLDLSDCAEAMRDRVDPALYRVRAESTI